MPADKTNLLRDGALLLFAAGLVFWVSLGAYPLFDEDEPKNAVCGMEMFQRGDWLVPTFNGGLRTDKPILIYWIMLTSFQVFGVTEFAARFGSSLCATGSVLLTWWLGRHLVGGRAGFLGGLILCTACLFATVGRAVTPDSILLFCLLSGLTVYVVAVARRHGGQFGATADGVRRLWREFVPATRWESALMYAAFGCAVLAKGPVGVLLPCAVIGLFLLVRRAGDEPLVWPQSGATELSWRTQVWRACLNAMWVFHPVRIVVACGVMRVPLGALVVLVVAVPWYAAVGVATNGAWLAGFLGDHNVGRFTKPMENHSGPLFYYLPVLCVGLFPWSPLFPVVLGNTWRRLRAPSTENGATSDGSAALQFLTCWCVFWISFFSLAGTKLPNYILPSYPALALLCGAYLSNWLSDSTAVRLVRFRRCLISLASGGAVMIVGLVALALILLPGEEWLALLGVVPLVGAWWIDRAARAGARGLAVQRLAVCAVVMVAGITGWASVRVGSHLEARPLVKAMRTSGTHGTTGDRQPMGTYEYFAPSLVWYHGEPVTKLNSVAAVEQFWREHPAGLIVTRGDRVAALEAQLLTPVNLVAEVPRFLRRHNTVVLGRVETGLREAVITTAAVIPAQATAPASPR